jgi:hypothetical protein
LTDAKARSTPSAPSHNFGFLIGVLLLKGLLRSGTIAD